MDRHLYSMIRKAIIFPGPFAIFQMPEKIIRNTKIFDSFTSLVAYSTGVDNIHEDYFESGETEDGQTLMRLPMADLISDSFQFEVGEIFYAHHGYVLIGSIFNLPADSDTYRLVAEKSALCAKTMTPFLLLWKKDRCYKEMKVFRTRPLSSNLDEMWEFESFLLDYGPDEYKAKRGKYDGELTATKRNEKIHDTNMLQTKACSVLSFADYSEQKQKWKDTE